MKYIYQQENAPAPEIKGTFCPWCFTEEEALVKQRQGLSCELCPDHRTLGSLRKPPT